MISIRVGVFETNSSSAHGLILAKQSDFNLFKKNKFVLYMPSLTRAKLMSFEDAYHLALDNIREHSVGPVKEFWSNEVKNCFGTDDLSKVSLEMFIDKVLNDPNYWAVWNFYSFKRWQHGSYEGKSTYKLNPDTGFIELDTYYFDG